MVRVRRNVIVASGGVLLLAAGYGLAACGGDGGDASDTTAATTLATTPPLETTTGTTTLVTPSVETTTTLATTTTLEQEEPTEIRIVVVNGQPKGGIVRKTLRRGDPVVLVVESDVADEVHIHGYDISKDVEVGGTARISFRATVPGRFEVELEGRGVQIADLTVLP